MASSSSPKTAWIEIKAAYQRGEGSCAELAERFGISFDAVRGHCKREKWAVEKAQIGSQVAQKVVQDLSARATAWVEATLQRCERYRKDIDASRNQMPEDRNGAVLMDSENMDDYAKVEKRIDDMARRACGMPDKPQIQLNLTQSTEISPELRDHLILIQKAVEKTEEVTCQRN